MSHEIKNSEFQLLLIEKVLVLKSLSIFEETPETVLAEVAEILEEEVYKEGTTIFREGDVGHCLYVLFKGEVRIHKDNHTLATLKENAVFGELALLDIDNRSASATANTEALVLKIDQEPFYEIMENRIEVARGIIKILCRRLRAQNTKSVQQSKSQS